MEIIGTHGTGSVLSNWYDSATGPGDILSQISDNNTNEIVAKDIRDSVFTLWSMIKEVEVTAASGASAAQFFTNTASTPNTVGGIPAGSTFPTNHSMQQMWDLLLYPYIPPSCSLSSPIVKKEYGANSSISLDWSVTKNTLPIGEILVNNVLQDPNLTTGSQPSNGTHSLYPGPSETNTFTMSVSDIGTASNNTSICSVDLKWMNTVYAGSIDLSSFGQSNVMNITSYELAISNHISPTFSNILNKIKHLSDTKNRTYTGINGASNFLFFAWPRALPGSLTPSFEVNNLPNTAFTMINATFSHENESGFIATYSIWLSNTAQNSPLNIKIS